MININNYASVIYVDSVNGNDTIGDGSVLSSYATVQYALNKVSVDNTLIYLKEGNYRITEGLSSLIKTSFQVTFVSEGIFKANKNVVFSLENTLKYQPKMTKLNEFIGIIFRRNSGGDARVWEYFYDTATLNLSFKNCVFEAGIVTPSTFVIYTGNASGATVNKLDYINCAFTVVNLTGSFTGVGLYKGTLINCAIADSNLTTQPNNLLSATFNSDYSVANSQVAYGVYFGDNQWKVVSPKILIRTNVGVYVYYRQSDNTWQPLGHEPTDEDFLNLGVDNTLTKVQLEQLVAQGIKGKSVLRRL